MKQIMKLSTAITFMVLGLTVAFAAHNSNADTNFTDPKPLVTETDTPQIHCLAMNIYHEARNESLAGQAAVADVVLNRVKDRRYPSTICEVVHDGPVKESWKTRQTPDPDDAVYHPIRNRCQFSWYCDGKSDEPKNRVAWESAKLLAWQILREGRFVGVSQGATHYHATYVDPSWARAFRLVGRIDTHIFYRAD